MNTIEELQTYDRLLKPYPLYRTARKYAVFVTGGGIDLLLSLLITTPLTEFLGIPYWISYFFGLVAAILFTFIYHRHVTFGMKSAWKSRFLKFGIVVTLIVIANYFLVLTATEILQFHYLISIFLVTLILSVINFGVNKIWVFKS